MTAILNARWGEVTVFAAPWGSANRPRDRGHSSMRSR